MLHGGFVVSGQKAVDELDKVCGGSRGAAVEVLGAHFSDKSIFRTGQENLPKALGPGYLDLKQGVAILDVAAAHDRMTLPFPSLNIYGGDDGSGEILASLIAFLRSAVPIRDLG